MTLTQPSCPTLSTVCPQRHLNVNTRHHPCVLIVWSSATLLSDFVLLLSTLTNGFPDSKPMDLPAATVTIMAVSVWSITSDETKFWHILAAFGAETSARSSRLTTQVKTGVFLVETYSPSHWEWAEHIISLTVLGDRRPLAVLNYMSTTLGNFRPEILMQQIFLKTLLAQVQDTVTGSKVTDLESLGD